MKKEKEGFDAFQKIIDLQSITLDDGKGNTNELKNNFGNEENLKEMIKKGDLSSIRGKTKKLS